MVWLQKKKKEIFLHVNSANIVKAPIHNFSFTEYVQLEHVVLLVDYNKPGEAVWEQALTSGYHVIVDDKPP